MRNKLAVVLDLVEDGSRLHPLTDHRPVASIPFDSRYRLIDFPFSSMYNAQLISAAIFISGSGHSLYDHIRNGSVWGLDSNIGGGVFTHSHVEQKLYYQENDEDKQAYFENHRKYISRTSANQILVAGSLTLAAINLDALLQYHETHENKVTGVFKILPRNKVAAETEVKTYEVEDNLITSVSETSPENADSEENFVAGAKTVIVDKEFMLEFLDWAEENIRQVRPENVIEYALEIGQPVSAFEYTGYMAAIETIQTYYDANMDMLEEANYNSLFFRNGSIVTRPHNGSPTYYGTKSDVLHSHLATNCEIYGKVYQSIVFRNTNILEGATVEHAIVNADNHIAANATVRYAILDKNVTVEEGVRIEGTADNPVVIPKGTVVSQDITA